MPRVRVEQTRRPREELPPILPLDPRDADVIRAKRVAQEADEAEEDRVL